MYDGNEGAFIKKSTLMIKEGKENPLVLIVDVVYHCLVLDVVFVFKLFLIFES